MKQRIPLSALLWLAVGVAGVGAACGGALGGNTASVAHPAGSATTIPKDRPGQPGPKSDASVSELMKPVAPTKLDTELRALQLDLATLPPLAKLDGDRLRKVMTLFTQSLGAKCSDCHADDFSAPTPMKKVATRMWDDFVRGAAQEGGSRVFCDSCHQGHLKFLDRHDKSALSDWMDTNFVAHLKRTDGKEAGCDKCHGDPFEGKFLATWAGAPLP